MFQPLKHWHSEAVNEAIQNGDETFSKVEFLAAFNTFRAKAFKSTMITSAWRKTGLIPYNPEVVLQKVRESLPPPREITLPSSIQSIQETPRTVRQLSTVAADIMMHSRCSDELTQMIAKFVKRAVSEVRKGELLEQRWDQQTKAKKVRKARKRESNKVLQIGGILTARKARSMIRDRQNQEAQREKDRMIAWEKRYSLALGKVAKQTKAHRKLKMTKSMNSIKDRRKY